MGLNLNQLATIQAACGDSIALLLEKRQDKYLQEVTKPLDAKFGFDQALKILQENTELFKAINLSAEYAGTDAQGRMREALGEDVKYWEERRNEYNAYRLDWMNLHVHIRKRTEIPQDLKDRMQNAHPNFNLLYVAHMAEYESNLKKEIKEENIVSDLVRLHEACLGMTPLTEVTGAGYAHLRHRLGRVPFNLDKMGDASTKPEEYREVVSWLIQIRMEDRSIAHVRSTTAEQEIVNLMEHMKQKHMLTEELITQLRDTNASLENVRKTLADVRLENERIKEEKEALKREVSNLNHQIQIQPGEEDDNRTPLLQREEKSKPTCKDTASKVVIVLMVASFATGLTVGLVGYSNDNSPPLIPGIVSFNYNIPWQNGGEFCIVNDDSSTFDVSSYQFTLRGKILSIWGPKTNSLFTYGSRISTNLNSDSTYTHIIDLPSVIHIPPNNNYCTQFNIDPTSVKGPLKSISGFLPVKYPVIADSKTLPIYHQCSASACENPIKKMELSLDYVNSYTDDPQNNPVPVPTKFINALNYRVDFNATGELIPSYADSFLIAQAQKAQQQYPYLKNYLEIGNWGKGDDFTKIVSNTDTAAFFTQNLVQSINQTDFNGISIKLDLISGKLPLNNEGTAAFFTNLRYALDDAYGHNTIPIKIVVPGSRYAMNLLQSKTWERIAEINPIVTVNTNLNGAYSNETNFQSPLNLDKNDPQYAKDPTLSIAGTLKNYQQLFPNSKMGPTVYMDGQCIKIATLGARRDGVWVPPIGECGTIPYNIIATGGFSQVTCVPASDSPYNATMSSFCYSADGPFFVTYTGISDVQAMTRYLISHVSPYRSITVTSTSGKWGDTISIKGAREELSLIATISRTANNTDSHNPNLSSQNTTPDKLNYFIQQIQLPTELKYKILEAAGKGILSTYLLELISKGFLQKYLEERNYSKAQIFIIDQSVRALITLFALEGTLKNTLVTFASPIAVKILTKLGFSGTTANAVVTGGIMSASVYASPLTAIPTILCSIPAAKLAHYVADSAPMKLAYTKTSAAAGYLAETRPVKKTYEAVAYAANNLFAAKDRMSALANKVNPFAKNANAITEEPLDNSIARLV